MYTLKKLHIAKEVRLNPTNHPGYRPANKLSWETWPESQRYKDVLSVRLTPWACLYTNCANFLPLSPVHPQVQGSKDAIQSTPVRCQDTR